MSYAAQRVLRSLVIATALLVTFSFFEMPASAQIKLTGFVDPHPVVAGGTIGFAFAGTKFVGSAQGDGTGILYSTDLNGGNVKLFAPGVNVAGGTLQGEHYVVSSLGLGGFPLWDIYVAAGPGVLHITNDGNTSDLLATGLASPVRGLVFDSVGTFGHDLLASTINGEVYRIKSSGAVKLLASLEGEDVEGMDIAPLGAGFGSFDGQLITVSEDSGLLRAVSPTGTVTVLNSSNPIPKPERLSFVPLNLGATGSPLEGFYSANYPSNVVKATASQFMSFKGDAIVTTEAGDRRISRVHWDGSAFEVTVIGTSSGQAEDGFILGPAVIDPGLCLDPKAREAHDSNAWCWPNCGKIEPRLQ
jgi:hypothetical protein